VGHRVSLEKRKISGLYRDYNPGPPARILVTIRCTLYRSLTWVSKNCHGTVSLSGLTECDSVWLCPCFNLYEFAVSFDWNFTCNRGKLVRAFDCFLGWGGGGGRVCKSYMNI
jgi:hypothetical protein